MGLLALYKDPKTLTLKDLSTIDGKSDQKRIEHKREITIDENNS